MISDSKIQDFHNLSDHIFEIASKYPEKLAFNYPDRITYKEFWNYIIKLSAGLYDKNINEGTLTILLLKPGIEFFAFTFAMLRIGAIPVLIDPGMGVNNMLKALQNIKPEAFIGTHKALILRFIGKSKLSKVDKWLSVKWIRDTMLSDNYRDQNHNQSYSYKLSGKAAIFFTSGSTGPPKPVMYTNEMLLAQINILKEQFNYSLEEIDLCTFPLVSLLLMNLGVTVAIADMNMLKPSKLNPSRLVENINNLDCTSMFCSPMVLQRLSDYCNKRNIKLNGLRKVLSAGAPVKPELLLSFRQLLIDDCRIYTPYGATEVLPVTNISDIDLFEKYEEEDSYTNGICIGAPLRGITLKIIHITDNPIANTDEMKEVNINEIGEIIVSGKNVTREYVNNDKANKFSKILDREKGLVYHRMGDLGRIDNDGYIWFYGRKSQRVISNNITLYTIPCEAVFNKHEDVRRSALVGILFYDFKSIQPVICIETNRFYSDSHKKRIKSELIAMSGLYSFTKDIREFVFIRKFPVDPRHNAKIFREKLTQIAQKKYKI